LASYYIKVEKKRNPYVFLATYLELVTKNLDIGEIMPLKFGEFGPWKIVCISQNHIFRSEFGENSQIREKHQCGTTCQTLYNKGNECLKDGF
jgi:hypothetical protein